MDTLLGLVQRSCADKYAVERTLGRGGTALVYLARDLRHQRMVALKLLDPELALVVGAARFRREIDIAARLNHPHIVPLLDSGEIALARPASPEPLQVPYYVMPYVPGDTLRDRIAQGGTFPAEEAIRIAREIADALDYAHRAGVVHRDVKPENIFFHEGHALVADFGIARALDNAGAERVTGIGVMVGTPLYMSPEQVAGEPNIDGRADLYSLGCVLYEMLVGAPPFHGDSLQAVMTRRLSEPAPKLSTSGVRVAPYVHRALERALATDPNFRFDTAGEFGAALGGATIAEPRARFRPALLLGVALTLLATVGAAFLLRGRSAGQPIGSLAVLPLADARADSATAYLREGIPEAVADLLRRLPQVTITAPSLVSQLLARQPDLDLRELGRRLGVEAFLAGRLRRVGDSLELRTELVRVDDGRMLWSQTYTGPIANILTVERQIARAITDSLRLGLTPEQRAALGRPALTDPVAYDLYLRGRHLWTKATPLGAAGAEVNGDSVLYYADEVRRRAPDFVGGYFLQAAYYPLAGIRGWRKPLSAMLDSAQAAARRAIDIDPQFGDAWTMLGFLHFQVTDDWREARRLLRRGLELNAANPQGQAFWGLYLGEVDGEIDSAIVHLRAAVEIDSQVPFLNSLGDMYLRARKFDSAAIALAPAVRLEPRVPGPRARLIRALEETGRLDSALAVRRGGRDTALVPELVRALATDGPAGYRRVLAGDLARRATALEAAIGRPADELTQRLPPTRERRLALTYALLGDPSRAADWILREFQIRPARFRTALVDPDLAGIRRDPRIVALARRLRLDSLTGR